MLNSDIDFTVRLRNILMNWLYNCIFSYFPIIYFLTSHWAIKVSTQYCLNAQIFTQVFHCFSDFLLIRMFNIKFTYKIRNSNYLFNIFHTENIVSRDSQVAIVPNDSLSYETASRKRFWQMTEPESRGEWRRTRKAAAWTLKWRFVMRSVGAFVSSCNAICPSCLLPSAGSYWYRLEREKWWQEA